MAGGVKLVLCRRYHRSDRAVREELLELIESAAGYYDDAVKVNDFYDFSFACELGESEDVWLDLRIGGCSIPLRWSVKELARSAYALRHTRAVDDRRVCADPERSKFVVDHLTGKKREAALKLLDGRVPRWKTRLNHRLVRRRANRETVWFYTAGPEGSGAAWQAFQQDTQRNDGISRYYAARPDACSAAMSPLVDGASAAEATRAGKKVGQSGAVVAFCSRRDKTLFCAAKKLLVSDEAYDSYAPMPEKILLDFADLFNAEISEVCDG